jgi:PAS domain S-box-containing protein
MFMVLVLVLGDDRTLDKARSMFAGSIEHFTCTLVSSPNEAVEEISHHPFDLFVSDYPESCEAIPPLMKGLEDCKPAMVVISYRNNQQDLPNEHRLRTRELFTELGSKIGKSIEKSLSLEREREQQNRLCSILSSINTGVFVVDERTGTILHANQYASRLIEESTDLITGLDYRVFLAFDDNIVYSKPFLDESVVQSQGRLTGRDGREIPVLFNITPVRIFGGKHLLITFLDNSSRKLAEEALIESENRFRILVETSPDAIFLTDLNGKVLNANFNAMSPFGDGAQDSLPAESLFELYALESSSVLAAFLQRLLDEGRVREKHIVRTTNGRTFPIEISSSILMSSEGKPFSLIHVIRDLTLQHEAETALKASEERYRNVIEDQTEFICRFRPDGTHVFVNGAYCRYFGKTRKEIVGSRFIPVIPPDDRAALERHFASLTSEHPIDTIEHRIIMPDKSIRWQRWSDRAIFDNDGAIVEYQSVGRDITDRKNAEEADRLLSFIVKSTDDAIIALTPDGRILSWNPGAEQMFGYSASEVTGKDIRILASPEHAIEVDEKLDKVNRGERVDHFETKRVRKDGTLTKVSVTISPLSDEKGRIFGASAIYRDISPYKDEVRKCSDSTDMTTPSHVRHVRQ